VPLNYKQLAAVSREFGSH